MNSITYTSISLSWGYPRESAVLTSEVVWYEVISSDDPIHETEDMTSGSGASSSGIYEEEYHGGTRSGTSGTIDSLTTSYTLENLESNTSYKITITVNNRAGSTVSNAITVTTGIIKATTTKYGGA